MRPSGVVVTPLMTQVDEATSISRESSTVGKEAESRRAPAGPARPQPRATRDRTAVGNDVAQTPLDSESTYRANGTTPVASAATSMTRQVMADHFKVNR